MRATFLAHRTAQQAALSVRQTRAGAAKSCRLKWPSPPFNSLTRRGIGKLARCLLNSLTKRTTK